MLPLPSSVHQIPHGRGHAPLGGNAKAPSWIRSLFRRGLSLLATFPARPPQGLPGPGDRIVNDRGIPGTLACIARSRETGKPVLLSVYHVLFGDHAGREERVWADSADGRGLAPIGRTLRGKIGLVPHRLGQTFIDCALAETAGPERRGWWKRHAARPSATGMAEAQLGEKVRKIGSSTGGTEGFVDSLTYCQASRVNGIIHQAINQILIKPAAAGGNFSEKGDSGAAVLNERNEIVGLLWGTTALGEGVACPILPVAEALQISVGGN